MTRSIVESAQRAALGSLGSLLGVLALTGVASAQCPYTVPGPPTAFPADSAFREVGCLNPDLQASFDSCSDEARDHRNIIGGGTSPAFQYAQDGSYLYLRVRLEQDPRQGGALVAFAWGFGLDSDNDGQFEAYITAIGQGNEDRVEILDQDASNGTTCNLTRPGGSGVDTSLRPILTDLTGGTWVSVTVAPPTGSSFCPDRPTVQNYFLTVAVPLSVLNQFGALGGLFAYAGTSSEFSGIQNDFVCFNGNPPTCTTGTTCPSGICLATGRCAPPITPFFLGCVEADANGDGIQDGCTAATPYCLVGSGTSQCVACRVDSHCNDSNACTTDRCVANSCVRTPVSAGTPCTGGFCNGSTTAPLCAPCIDSASGSGTDLGCSAASPYCDTSRATPACVQCLGASDCNDGNDCTTDACVSGTCARTPRAAGASCAGGVCNGSSTAPLCLACIDDVTGSGIDSGCSATTPLCDTSGTAPICVRCLGAADCNDGNACTTDSCVAGACLNTSLGAGSTCPGGVCNGAPVAPLCITCLDSAPAAGLDAGCGASAPICNTAGPIPICVPCVDTAIGSGIDLGCGGGTPFCNTAGPIPVCAECLGTADCNDGNECTTDACVGGACIETSRPVGSSCAGGVCDGAASSPLCRPCVDTSASGTDAGCSGSTPFCDTSGSVPVCVACLTAANCNDDNDCTTDACVSGACQRTSRATGASCAGGVCNGSTSAPLCVTCVNDATGSGVDSGCSTASPFCDTSGTAPVCVECLAASDCNDANECTTDACTAGACVNTSRPTGTTCATGVCTGTAIDPSCAPCVNDAAPGAVDSGCTAATPLCDTSGSIPVCVTCRSNADCSDGNECTTDTCSAGVCSVAARDPGSPCSAGVCDVNTTCSAVAVSITAPDEGEVLTTPTPTISGTATPGQTVTVSIDGVVVGTVTAGADGSWSLPLTTPLSDGAHTATATVSTAAGDATDSTAFVVDATTNVAITTPTDGGTTTDATPDLRGTGEPGATIVVTLDGVEIGTVTVEADGTWVLLLDEPLRNGEHTVSVTATDASGNTATDEVTFTVNANTDIAITEPANESVTNDNTPTIRGTAVPGATIVITIDGEEVGTVTADEEGNWELPVTTALDDGEHVVIATATDPAGNTASDSSTFTVDTRTTVRIVSVTPQGVITGTGEPGATIVIVIDGVEVGTVTVDEDGNWTFDTGEPFGPGTYTVTARSTDPAGNTAMDTTDLVVELPPDGGPPPVDGGVQPIDAGPPRGGFSGGALCAVQPGANGGAAMGLLLLGLLGLLLVRRRR